MENVGDFRCPTPGFLIRGRETLSPLVPSRLTGLLRDFRIPSKTLEFQKAMKSPPYVLKEDRWFACFDESGVISPGSEGLEGIYFRDIRLVDRLEYRFEGIRLSAAYSDISLSHRLFQRLVNESFISDFSPGSLELVLTRFMSERGYVEELELINHSENRADGNFEIDLHLDFADLMEVRQMHRDKWDRPCQFSRPTRRSLKIDYEGKDGFQVHFLLECNRDFSFADDRLIFPVALGPDESTSLSLVMGASIQGDEPIPLPDPIQDKKILENSVEDFRSSLTRIETDHEDINQILRRCADDLRLLWLWGDDEKTSGCIAAGIPHFVALFGRDSLIAAFEFMMMKPELAKFNLRELARLQGKKFVEMSEEEPGKILHEWRTGERSHPDIYPYTYATLDASPLFCMLLSEYVNWTGDVEFIREMEPALRGILTWCVRYGDLDDDGFLEYLDLKLGSLGLVHRGWKDGEPAAVTNGNGELPKFPIAMVEFQGYYHDALIACTDFFRFLGDEEVANDCEKKAKALKEKFNEAFWWPEERIFAEAIDGDKKIVDAVSTNPGHCLLGDIMEKEKIELMAARFFEEDVFTGFGLRCLSLHSRAYSPFRYQRGAVWPHDNALVAFGLSRHGFTKEANRIAGGILEAATQLENHRLPELFSGLSREETHGRVVPIGIACKPQGWAAASPFLLLRAILGVFPDARNHRIILRPDLEGTPLTSIRVTGLKFAGGSLDFSATLTADGTRVDGLEKRGDFEVVVERANG